MDSEEAQTAETNSVYDASSLNDKLVHNTSTESSLPADEAQDVLASEEEDKTPPQLFSPRMKLDPQLLENYYINLNGTSESALQETAQHMHAMVNDIVAVLETNRQEILEANLATCRSLIKDIQQMECEQDTMKYQIEMYTHKVRQAHDEIFKKNSAKK